MIYSSLIGLSSSETTMQSPPTLNVINSSDSERTYGILVVGCQPSEFVPEITGLGSAQKEADPDNDKLDPILG